MDTMLFHDKRITYLPTGYYEVYDDDLCRFVKADSYCGILDMLGGSWDNDEDGPFYATCRCDWHSDPEDDF
jgi:hypothetical protein